MPMRKVFSSVAMSLGLVGAALLTSPAAQAAETPAATAAAPIAANTSASDGKYVPLNHHFDNAACLEAGASLVALGMTTKFVCAGAELWIWVEYQVPGQGHR